MKSPVFRSFLGWGFMGALMINAILLCSIPGIVSTDTEKNDLESLNVLQITRFKEPPPPLEKHEKQKKEEVEEKQEKPLKVSTPKPLKITPSHLAMNLPAMDLDVDPRITGGIPVVAAPASQTPQSNQEAVPDFNAIDFNAVMDQSKLDTIPVPSYKNPPKYPYQAKRLGIGGEVKIKFLVDKVGNVSDITILEARPPDIFNQSVIDAVASWKYYPGELSGRKVATIVTTTIVFKLEES